MTLQGNPPTRQTMTDVYVDAAAVNWTSGAFYQVETDLANTDVNDLG